MHQPRLPRRTRQSRRGATVVEFAFVLPILLLFFTTSIELFRLSQMRHAADSAAYEACRAVIVPGANQAEAVAKAQKMMSFVGVKNPNVTINPSTITEQTSQVTVNVSIPAKGNSWVASAFSEKSIVMASSTLLTERVPSIQASGIPQPKK